MVAASMPTPIQRLAQEAAVRPVFRAIGRFYDDGGDKCKHARTYPAASCAIESLASSMAARIFAKRRFGSYGLGVTCPFVHRQSRGQRLTRVAARENDRNCGRDPSNLLIGGDTTHDRHHDVEQDELDTIGRLEKLTNGGSSTQRWPSLTNARCDEKTWACTIATRPVRSDSLLSA